MIEGNNLDPDLTSIANTLRFASLAISRLSKVEHLDKAVDKGITEDYHPAEPLKWARLQASYWVQRARVSGDRLAWNRADEAYQRQIELTPLYSYPNNVAKFNQALSLLQLGLFEHNFKQLTRAYIGITEHDLVMGRWHHLTGISLIYLGEVMRRGRIKESKFALDNISTAGSRTGIILPVVLGRAITGGIATRIARGIIDWYYSSPEDGNRISSKVVYTGKI